MKINDNGVVRDMTPEEEAEMERMQAEMPPTTPDPTEQKLAQMQAQIDALLEGRTG